MECDYDDPVKRKYCPPVPVSPFAVEAPAASVAETAASSADSPDAGAKKSISAELIAKCLENPADPDCRQLDEDEEEAGDVAAPASAPASFLGRFLESDGGFPAQVIKTEAPTKNDCYGLMLDPRFCASSMPSASFEPTKAEGTLASPICLCFLHFLPIRLVEILS